VSGCVAVLALALAAAACGAQRSSLPPPPAGANGFVPLKRLARFPEVYANAQLTTIGTVHRVAGEELKLTAAGVRTSISIYPARLATPLRGRLVRASGRLSLTFQTGYELRLSAITPISG
jgi:hypothetical protein